jgi:hypothetical protein
MVIDSASGDGVPAAAGVRRVAVDDVRKPFRANGLRRGVTDLLRTIVARSSMFAPITNLRVTPHPDT